MRHLGMLLLSAFLMVVPVAVPASEPAMSLRVSVDTFAIRKIDDATPSRVLFAGTPIKAEVMLTVAPTAPASTRTMPVPDEWWHKLAWEVRGKDQKVLSPRAELTPSRRGEAAMSRELKGGDRLAAQFTLGELPPGEYRLTVRLGDLQSEPEWFLVSNGRENEDLRREFARYKVDRSADRTTLQASLLELAASDPLNASPWIRLGDLALRDGSVAVIQSYYGRALDVLDHRRKKFAAEGRAEVVSAIRSESAMIMQVRELVPYFVANRTTVVLHADLTGGKHYVLRERKTGRVLRSIAPVSADERPVPE